MRVTCSSRSGVCKRDMTPHQDPPRLRRTMRRPCETQEITRTRGVRTEKQARSCDRCDGFQPAREPMGTALARMLRADAEATGTPVRAGPGPPVILRSPARLPQRTRPGPSPEPDREADRGRPARTAAGSRGPRTGARSPDPERPIVAPRRTADRTRPASIARRLQRQGKPVSRRALRSGGVRGNRTRP